MVSLMKSNSAVKITEKKYTILAVLIGILVFLVMLPCLGNYFSGDDFFGYTYLAQLKDNPSVLLERYSWLTTIFYSWMNVSLYGQNPAGYFLSNILVHLANVFMLGYFVRRLFKDDMLSLLVMFIFGVSPGYVESIFWISGVGHALLFFFIMLTLISFTAFLEKRNTSLLLLAVVFAFLAHLTIFDAAILPLLLLLTYWVFENKPLKKIFLPGLIKTSPFILITGVYVLTYLFVKTTQTIGSYYEFNLSLFARAGKYFLDYADFLRINYLLYGNMTAIVISGILMTVVLVFLVFWIKDRVLKYGLLFTLFSMLPYLPVKTVAFFQYSRYRYIPFAGFSLILAYLLFLAFRNLMARKKKDKMKKPLLALLFIFLVIYTGVNIYYIQLEEKGYKLFGEYHRALVENIRPLAPSLPKDGLIIFFNDSNVCVPKDIAEKIQRRPMFVRGGAPWGLISVDDLLNFMNLKSACPGYYYRVEAKDEIIAKIRSGEYEGLLFTDKKGFSLFKFNDEFLKKALPEWEKASELGKNVTVLKCKKQGKQEQ